MARVDVRLSGRAIRDLDAIADYIAQQGAAHTALSYVDRIHKRCIDLGDFPGSGRRFASPRGMLRILPFEGVMIIYREMPNGVRIIAIFNQRQDYRAQLRHLR